MPDMLAQLVSSPGRILAIAGTTFTQLMRMRLFVVLAAFALGFLGLQFVPYQANLGVESQGIGQLQLIKDAALGSMSLFGMIFCVAATSLLIPRDSEDRILYTILCKPVPRFDYLVGKAFGVLGLLGLMLLLMDAMMVGLLWLREGHIVSEMQQAMQAQGFHAQDIALISQQIADAGNSWEVQRSIIAMYLGFGVLSTFTLLISCVTSGTIVSMIFALGAYFIGMFQAQFFQTITAGAQAGTSAAAQWAERAFAVFVPDFSIFNITDAASSGVELSWGILGGLSLIALAYMLLHLLIATWIFAHKEF